MDGLGLGLAIPMDIYTCLVKEVTDACNPTGTVELLSHISRSGLRARFLLFNRVLLMYVSCGLIDNARQVFDKMPLKDCVLKAWTSCLITRVVATLVWTAKIVNNCREEHFDKVLDGFREMGSEGVKKNGFTFSSVLRACGRMEDDGQCGRQVHANEIKLGLELNDFVRGGLVDTYAKRGLLTEECENGV
ncbi:pentatricopeptide repeat-containing protein At1g31790-like [Actinidia eriantha]|uniref:pentatricopeptide repeat-containing protein At1g31790-like n=1 Tax=Actinidia eriantha TaxID=165200 RepID=UPI0025867A72|nr:pentatricopeptide repeat-containing protein At1g31790-like [Actinidia eriantha]